MKGLSSIWVVLILFILVSVFVSAEDYTATNAQEFDMYLDYRAVPVESKTYASVVMPDTKDYKCINMAFYIDNSTGTEKYIHVQSNPVLASSAGISLRLGKTTPEEQGYFDIPQGRGTIYFTKVGIKAYEPFLFVVQCSDSNGTVLAREERITPAYREFAPNAPSRVVWFNQNSSMIMFAVAVIFLIVLFIYARMSR